MQHGTHAVSHLFSIPSARLVHAEASLTVPPPIHSPPLRQVAAASRRILALQQLLGGRSCLCFSSCPLSPFPSLSQVAAASRRILALQQLLGGGDVDVVWMLVREPRLLSADFRR